MKISEADARQACRNDGLDPDKLIKGRPAWKLYTRAEESQPEPDVLPPEALGVFTRMEDREAKMRTLDDAAQKDVEYLRALLVGKRVRSNKSIYQITHVYSGYLGRVEARGKKITVGGKLGSQSWNLHRIRPEDFADGFS